MGQVIKCSYRIPDSLSGEHLTDIDESTQDNRCRILTLSLEVESNFPVFSNKTIISTDQIIRKINNNINIHETGGLDKNPIDFDKKIIK